MRQENKVNKQQSRKFIYLYKLCIPPTGVISHCKILMHIVQCHNNLSGYVIEIPASFELKDSTVAASVIQLGSLFHFIIESGINEALYT